MDVHPHQQHTCFVAGGGECLALTVAGPLGLKLSKALKCLHQDCRCIAATPAVSGVSGHEASRLFVLRVSAVGEAEVPISANGSLQRPALARLGKAAEEETPEATPK